MRGAEPRTLDEYLGDILNAIERIQRYTFGMDEEAFIESEIVSDAVIKRVEVIGEAASQLSQIYKDFAASNTDLPLRIAADTRNALSHGYYEIALKRIWLTIQTDLPPLYNAILVKRARL